MAKKMEVKIVIEKEMALLLAMLISSSSQGSMEVYKLLTPKSQKQFLDVAQSIANQVAKHKK